MIGTLHLASLVTRNTAASLWCCCCEEKVQLGGGTPSAVKAQGRPAVTPGRDRVPVFPTNPVSDKPFDTRTPVDGAGQSVEYKAPSFTRMEDEVLVTMPSGESFSVTGPAAISMTDTELEDFVFVLLATN